MSTEIIKDVLLCNKCKCVGYYKYKEGENLLLECENCKSKDAIVYCPNCDIYGEFVEDIYRKPKTWTCPYCGSKYILSEEFYNNPLIVKMKEKKREKNKGKKSHFKKLMWEMKAYYIIGYLVTTLFILLDQNSDLTVVELFLAPFIMSFFIGFSIYDLVSFIKEKKRSRTELKILSLDGLFHIGLTMLLAMIYIFIDVFFVSK